jgi:hypothetical protein
MAYEMELPLNSTPTRRQDNNEAHTDANLNCQ